MSAEFSEELGRMACQVAVGVVSGLSPLAGTILAWASTTVWAVVDAEKAKASPVAVAQLAADRAVELINDLRFGPKAAP